MSDTVKVPDADGVFSYWRNFAELCNLPAEALLRALGVVITTYPGNDDLCALATVLYPGDPMWQMASVAKMRRATLNAVDAAISDLVTKRLAADNQVLIKLEPDLFRLHPAVVENLEHGRGSLPSDKVVMHLLAQRLGNLLTVLSLHPHQSDLVMSFNGALLVARNELPRTGPRTFEHILTTPQLRNKVLSDVLGPRLALAHVQLDALRVAGAAAVTRAGFTNPSPGPVDDQMAVLFLAGPGLSEELLTRLATTALETGRQWAASL